MKVVWLDIAVMQVRHVPTLAKVILAVQTLRMELSLSVTLG